MSSQTGWTTGLLGHSWRATVTPWGAVHPWDGSGPLTWAIAADDRWHFPERETSVRQTLLSGTPVSETRVRVPNGDVVQHVWSASSTEGVSAVVMEFMNDSPMPLAVSLSRDDVVTPRSFHRLSEIQRPWPSEDRGIERPALVVPLGHRARIRVALSMTGTIADDQIDSLPDWETVVRGWKSITDRASLVDIAELVDAVPLEDVVRRRRTEIALEPPELLGRSVEAAATWTLAHRELVRMGLAESDSPDLASSLERLLRHVRKSRRVEANVADALRAGAFVLGHFDERALGDFTNAVQRSLRKCGFDTGAEFDLARGLRALPGSTRGSILDGRSDEQDLIGAIESDIAEWSAADEVTLMPDGFDAARLGVDFEAHRLPAGPGRSISLAVRWHGERPAVIWEVDGPPGLLLRSGSDQLWSSVEKSGEALWRVPAIDPVAR